MTDSVAPSAPTGLSGFDGGCPEAWLSWNPSSDDVDAAVLYEILVDGVRNDRAFATRSPRMR